MKPLPEHVEPLEKFDAEAIARWLRQGFEDLSHKTKRVTAFAPLNYFVRRLGDLTGELRDIYNALSGTAQAQFRIGIAIAFSNLPSNNNSLPTARRLLQLAGRIHASEILPVMIQRVGNGFFGLPEIKEAKELFAITLDIVAGMSPSFKVSETLRRLVASRFFQPEYAPMAFIGLCLAEPEGFPKHLDLLRTSFRAFHMKAGADDAYITACHFVNYVDTEIIALNLWHTHLSIAPDIGPWDYDTWLGNALFVGEKPPLRLRKENYYYTITRNEADRQAWKINIPENPENWDRSYDLRKFLDFCLEANRDLIWDHIFENCPKEPPQFCENLRNYFVRNSPIWCRRETEAMVRGVSL